MLEMAYLSAAAFAFIGAMAGNRVAWPLLASVIFCHTARYLEVEFNWQLWLSVDLLVAYFVSQLTSPRKLAILLLFIPILLSYVLYGLSYYHAAYVLSMVAGTAQLLLSFPILRTYRRWRGNFKNREEWTKLEMRAA